MTDDWHVCNSFLSFRASKTTLLLKKKGLTINFFKAPSQQEQQ